ncbi:hypothetical protein [Streptomyces fulvorobeus]|uniref:Uncharacterized protein n=1 Tax=Streptomyces fulvorobeus TaxID=284028 RepID=A0A7Y9HDV6_9ACTN|nr:hypothetical protein [Streptomyces fulvorobeus]NYE42722.1 hypothetical protein [Streptomyces fulvorobeus]
MRDGRRHLLRRGRPRLPHLWPDSEERTRAAVDKAYADRSAEAQPQVDEAA